MSGMVNRSPSPRHYGKPGSTLRSAFSIQYSVFLVLMSIGTEGLAREWDPYRRQRIEMTKNALDFLVSAANPDGSFGSSRQRLQTGAAVLAFLAAGERPGAGARGDVIARACRWLLNSSGATGFVGDKESPTESHAIAALALCQLVGMGMSAEEDRKLYKASLDALEYTLRSQDKAYGGRYSGGWTPEPRSKVNDRKASGWQMAFIHAMQCAGTNIPKSAILRGSAFMMASFKRKDEQTSKYDIGGFSYDADGLPVVAISAAGFYCMEAFGEPATERQLASEWFTNNPPVWNGPHFYDAQFFAVRALKLHASSSGDEKARERFREYMREVTEVLRNQQRPDGSFDVPPGNAEYTKEMGATYATPMAVLVLNCDRNLLPMDTGPANGD